MARVEVIVTSRTVAVSAMSTMTLELLQTCGAVAAVVVSSFVVLACFDGLGAENVVEIFTVIRACPVLNNPEHIVVHFRARVAQCWVMEDAYAVVQHLVHWYVGVVKCIHHTWYHVLQDLDSDLAGGFIENVGKVVL